MALIHCIVIVGILSIQVFEWLCFSDGETVKNPGNCYLKNKAALPDTPANKKASCFHLFNGYLML
jgi:hypothetical protein